MFLVRLFPLIIASVAIGLMVWGYFTDDVHWSITALLGLVVFLEVTKYIKNRNNPNLQD